MYVPLIISPYLCVEKHPRDIIGVLDNKLFYMLLTTHDSKYELPLCDKFSFRLEYNCH